MKSFGSLTVMGQSRRLRKMADQAAGRFGFGDCRLIPITHWENATYRLQTTNGPLLLRLHRPGYHTQREIHSELEWLSALAADGFPVPQPVSSPGSQKLFQVTHPTSGDQRLCSLLSWQNGRFKRKGVTHADMETAATLIARIHQHGTSWPSPAHFSRPELASEGLIGRLGGAGFREQAWRSLPNPCLDWCRVLANRIALFEKGLDHHRDLFGLIHGDSHLNNILFEGRMARMIDFDDCGRGYYLYDLATLLCQFRNRPDWPDWRTAALRGYRSIRFLPDDHRCSIHQLLDFFIGARLLHILLWMTDRAVDHPGMRPQLKQRRTMIIHFTRDILKLSPKGR